MRTSRTRKRISTRWPTANPSTTRYKVVLVPFPLDDLSATKVRPAVCLSEPIGEHRHVVLAFLTSRIPEQPAPTDLVLDSGDPDFATTGLRVSSTLQVHRMMTVTADLIQRELGHVAPRMQAEVEHRLRLLFGLK